MYLTTSSFFFALFNLLIYEMLQYIFLKIETKTVKSLSMEFFNRLNPTRSRNDGGGYGFSFFLVQINFDVAKRRAIPVYLLLLLEVRMICT